MYLQSGNALNKSELDKHISTIMLMGGCHGSYTTQSQNLYEMRSVVAQEPHNVCGYS